jgi:uncharacterized protein DUF4231
MATTQESGQLISAWAQQRIWSQAANRLKRRIDQARLAALLLGIATAVLAVAAGQAGGLSGLAGRVLSACAAITAGVATLVQRRASTGQTRDWTRARSASEGLKTEIYSYLAGGTAYTSPANRDQRLGAEAHSITEAVADLQRQTLGIKNDAKPIPPVRDTGSYISGRVDDQISNYYTPQSRPVRPAGAPPARRRRPARCHRGRARRPRRRLSDRRAGCLGPGRHHHRHLCRRLHRRRPL